MKLKDDMNQCPTCHKLFMDIDAFDLHRAGEMSKRRCLSAREMREVGLSPRMADGVWRKICSTT